MQIKERVFVITGGASGLGAATAEALVKAGGKVMLVDINAENLAGKTAELGAQSRGVVADIANEEQAARAINETLEAFGAIHGVVNCAGIGRGEKVIGRNGPHSLENFSRTINVNLIGSFNMLRFAAEAMSKAEPQAEAERGVIINTASIAAYDGQIGQVAYSASKAGLVGLTLPAARELAVHGIRVVTIAPGIFETPMMAGMTDDIRAALIKDVPYPHRLGLPHEFAALALHVVENTMLNGETIRLDAALRMPAK